jgi:hypothetical protein
MDLYQQAPHSSSSQDQRSQRVLNIALDDLANRFIETTPQLHADVQVMAAMIRELVNTEREKRGLDRLRGAGQLGPNQNKVSAPEPDFIGEAKIAGYSYRIEGRKSHDHFRGHFLDLKFLPK